MLPGPSNGGGVLRDQNSGDDRVRLTVEACVKPASPAKLKDVEQQVRVYLSTRNLLYQEGQITLHGSDSSYLSEHLQSISLADAFPSTSLPAGTQLLFWQVELDIRVFRLHSAGPTDADAAPDEASSYKEWDLPAAEFHGIWSSLVYDIDIKASLLAYATTALLFSDRGVDPQLVSFNRTVLLHGPPGTGKTSICKALAQRLAIKFASRWGHCQLIEVNAHSLFSKWFSESGKQVAGLFERIWEELEDDQSLVFVLIDEVESLTAARQAAIAGGEPADSIRAVNALLTHLDRLRTCPNVLILATSNLAAAVDAAFIDRADIKAYIGPPGPQGRYAILRSCLVEMQRADLLGSGSLASSGPGMGASSCAAAACAGMQDLQLSTSALDPSKLLALAASASEGLSGRALRKLPLLAFAELCQHQGLHDVRQVPVEVFVQRLIIAIDQEQQARQKLVHD